MGTSCEQTGTHTDMTEKITFPQLHWWAVNIWINLILEHPQRKSICLSWASCKIQKIFMESGTVC